MSCSKQAEKFYPLEDEIPSVIDKETSCQVVKIKKEYDPSYEQESSVFQEDAISIYSAIFNLSINSIPSIVAMVIEYSIFSLNIMFVRFLDDPVSMSGCGLGSMTANILVFSFGVGIWGGIDTLVSQSYGRKDYDLCKIYLNISKIVMIFLFVPLMMLLCFSEDLFILIGQPPESSHIAWKYLMICLPGLFFNMQFEWIRRYLLAMGDYYPAITNLIFKLKIA